ncbi:hypothetical protein DEU56DRAFT_723183 [Suillus clintonianus]|uniref:uncharacterized protein n=1 Tax=Suillus clintonianus TaxID=1904413 RepID=UPI001B86E6D0|nr:uncharacterized protein DEU56DRAFT_723183 [Suillus clintonianus]KAG2156395.1 hypothetical protein DEU56DRAFT_723183 [Suillus clintonianus]
MSTNTCNNPVICFASNLEHALRNSAELLESTSRHSSESYYNSNSVLLDDDGWMAGPHGRLLFWVPPASRQHSFIAYAPGTVLVITKRQELDLSRMAHGQHWSNCRDT